MMQCDVSTTSSSVTCVQPNCAHCTRQDTTHVEPNKAQHSTAQQARVNQLNSSQRRVRRESAVRSAAPRRAVKWLGTRRAELKRGAAQLQEVHPHQEETQAHNSQSARHSADALYCTLYVYICSAVVYSTQKQITLASHRIAHNLWVCPAARRGAALRCSRREREEKKERRGHSQMQMQMAVGKDNRREAVQMQLICIVLLRKVREKYTSTSHR